MRFPFFPHTEAAQQQHHLPRCEMTLLEDRARIEVVDRVTVPTAIYRQLTPFGLSKGASLFHRCAAAGTTETIWMKVFKDPLGTTFVIKQFNDWEFHSPYYTTIKAHFLQKSQSTCRC
jgi:hypothetical protein